MDSTAASHLSLLSTPELQKGGLPFWVFYLLLSVILLLIFINFLQKKDLRQRISYVLAGPRRRFSRLRIEALLKREENKKSELLKRLGELTSIQWPDLPEIEDISREIKALEEKNTGLQVEWHRIYKQLENLRQEKTRLMSSPVPDDNFKARQAELDNKIASMEKELKQVQASILATDEQLEPYHKTIGHIMYSLRPDREDLAFLYFQIDSLESKIRELKARLEKL
ncbi:MAG: hypothetical protein QHH43_01835 [Candidatus Saccharicenans sp.]|nr:hypothetical protein [Candidatus Saccharicenans sp.]MDH7574485.1 hypothetical protein [Candidatus Saccharicenans sp.]